MVSTLTWKYRRSCNHFDREVIISGESFHPLSLFAVWHWTRNDRKISFIQNSRYSSLNDSYGAHNLQNIITIMWLFQMPDWGYFINYCLKHWKFRTDALKVCSRDSFKCQCFRTCFLRKMSCYFKKQTTHKTRKGRNNSTGNNINITGERKDTCFLESLINWVNFIVMYIGLPWKQKWDSIGNVFMKSNMPCFLLVLHTDQSYTYLKSYNFHYVFFSWNNHGHDHLVISFIKIHHAFL